MGFYFDLKVAFLKVYKVMIKFKIIQSIKLIRIKIINFQFNKLKKVVVMIKTNNIYFFQEKKTNLIITNFQRSKLKIFKNNAKKINFKMTFLINRIKNFQSIKFKNKHL